MNSPPEPAIEDPRRLLAEAGHALRGPLTVLRGELELALTRERGPEEYQEVLHRCLDEVVRLTRLVEELTSRA